MTEADDRDDVGVACCCRRVCPAPRSGSAELPHGGLQSIRGPGLNYGPDGFEFAV